MVSESFHESESEAQYNTTASVQPCWWLCETQSAAEVQRWMNCQMTIKVITDIITYAYWGGQECVHQILMVNRLLRYFHKNKIPTSLRCYRKPQGSILWEPRMSGLNFIVIHSTVVSCDCPLFYVLYSQLNMTNLLTWVNFLYHLTKLFWMKCNCFFCSCYQLLWIRFSSDVIVFSVSIDQYCGACVHS